MSQVWLVLSGKGGVGKSTLSASLGVGLAKNGVSCCCVDTDLGLRSLDILFSLQSEVVFDVVDVTEKNCKLKYSLLTHHDYPSLSLLPASQLRRPGAMDRDEFTRVIRKLKKHFGYVIIDAPAGIGKNLDPLLEAADRVILVTTPDDIAVRDAENTIQFLEKKGKGRPILVVNRVQPRLVSKGVQLAPQTVSQVLDAPLLGFIPDDSRVAEALHEHRTPIEGRGPAKKALERVTARFLGEYRRMPSFHVKRDILSE